VGSNPTGPTINKALAIDLTIANQDRGLKVVFPMASKGDGREFAAALPRSV
jgi:hypothetical protein